LHWKQLESGLVEKILEQQNRNNRRLTSRGSPFSVTTTWVAGEARAKFFRGNSESAA